MLLTEVPQELQEPEIPRQMRFADPPKHAQIRLEQRKEAFRSILVHVSTRILLLCVIDERMQVAF
jgi:hypothetical protein